MSAASAIRAGGAYVELFTRDGKLTSGLRLASAKLQRFGASVTSLGTRMLGLGAAFATPLLGAAKLFADMGSDMLDMSQRTGVSVEALSELGFAAQQSGSSIEELEVALKHMQKGGFGRGAADLERIADELQALPDPAMRTARAVEIFGRAGTRLLPMMTGGAEGMRRLRDEAKRLGITMSTEDAVAAEAFGDSISALWAGLKRTAFTIGGALAPSLKEAAEWFGNTAKIIADWIKRNGALVRIVGAAVLALTAAGVALMILGPAISAVGLGIGVLATAFKGLFIVVGLVKGLILAFLSPIGLVLLALDGLRGHMAITAARSSGALATLGAAFRNLGQIASTTWGGIQDALATGDWQEAAQIALLGIRVAWSTTIAYLRTSWNQFSTFFVDVFTEASTTIARVINGFMTQFRNVITLLTHLAPAFANLNAGNLAGGIQGIANALGQAAPGVIANNAQGAQVDAAILQDQAIAAARRAAELAAANARDQAGIDAARNDLNALRNQIRQRRIDREWEMALAPGSARPDMDPSSIRSKVEARGTFSSYAISGLGASSVTDRIARATEETARNTRDNAQPTVT